MKAMLSAAALLLSFSVANAGIMTWDKNNSFKKRDVELYRSGHMQVGGHSLKMINFGSGSRVMMVVPIYVAQFLSSEPWNTRSEADLMPFVGRSKAIAIALTTKLNLTGNEIDASFKKALAKNNIDMNLPHIQACMNLIGTINAAKGKTFIITVVKNAAGNETMYVEDPNGTLLAPVDGPAGFAQQLFSVWLGVPADKSIADMKTEVLQGD